MIEKVYISFVAVLDKFLWLIDAGPSVHRFFLAPQIGNFRVVLGRIRAVCLYRFAIKCVSAYGRYVHKDKTSGPHVSLTKISLGDVPEIDKSNYIKQYSLHDKVIDGTPPNSGVTFDESSGSSGKPTSWVRGRKERCITQKIMQVAFKHLIDGDPVVINTFSMGAWATGRNTTICLIGVTRVKSIGPDIVKVIDVLKELGSDFNYVVLRYPSFLRQLAESEAINWKKYKIDAIYGGEGISESMCAQLLKITDPLWVHMELPISK